MMKKLFLLFLVAIAMVSCLDDDEVNPTGIYYGVVNLTDDVLGYEIVLDGGGIAVPSTSEVDYVPTEDDRVYFYIEILGSVNDNPLDVNLLGIVPLSTYDVVNYDSITVDVLGTDAVAVYNGGVSQNSKYLTFSYSYQEGETPKDHDFNLVYYPDSIGDDGEVFLKFQHNANNDVEETSASGYKSFDMSSIAPFANVTDSVAYTIKINPGDFSSAVSYFRGYFYNEKYLRQ